MLRQPNRRSFFFALPQVALTAACAFGAAHGSPTGPADGPPAGAARDGLHPTEPPAARGAEAAPGRALPLPTPVESDRLWLDEWLNFVSLTYRRVSSGC